MARVGEGGEARVAGSAVHGSPHLSVDGEGEAPRTAAVHGHVGLLHTPALQADLQGEAAWVRASPPRPEPASRLAPDRLFTSITNKI